MLRFNIDGVFFFHLFLEDDILQVKKIAHYIGGGFVMLKWIIKLRSL